MMEKRVKGPVEILCDEIGFRFDKRYERQEIFLSFVSVLVEQVAYRAAMDRQIVAAFGKPVEPTEFDRVLSLIRTAFDSDNPVANAAMTHNLIHEVNPEDGPCDHYIDMLSSCASAIRFGLEKPCHSRHAAEAASHIWKRIYGVSLFDQFTSAWSDDWARAQFQEAIFRLTKTSVSQHTENEDMDEIVKRDLEAIGRVVERRKRETNGVKQGRDIVHEVVKADIEKQTSVPDEPMSPQEVDDQNGMERQWNNLINPSSLKESTDE